MNVNEISEKVKSVSEIYARNHNIERDDDWYVFKLQEELGELVQSYLSMIGKGRTRGKTQEELDTQFNHEIADVFCSTLLLADKFNVDLEEAVTKKWLKWLDDREPVK